METRSIVKLSVKRSGRLSESLPSEPAERPNSSNAPVAEELQTKQFSAVLRPPPVIVAGERHERRLARRSSDASVASFWAVSGASRSRQSGTRGHDHLGTRGGRQGEEAGVHARTRATQTRGIGGGFSPGVLRHPVDDRVLTQGHWQTRKGCLTVERDCRNCTMQVMSENSANPVHERVRGGSSARPRARALL